MPHSDPAVIRASKDAGAWCLPGVATPTVGFAAFVAGADGLKLFPGRRFRPRSRLGGGFCRSLPLLPVGGVTPERMADYVAPPVPRDPHRLGPYRPGMPLPPRFRGGLRLCPWRAVRQNSLSHVVDLTSPGSYQALNGRCKLRVRSPVRSGRVVAPARPWESGVTNRLKRKNRPPGVGRRILAQDPNGPMIAAFAALLLERAAARTSSSMSPKALARGAGDAFAFFRHARSRRAVRVPTSPIRPRRPVAHGD